MAEEPTSPESPHHDSPQNNFAGYAKNPPAWASLHLWQIQGVRDVLIVIGVIALFLLGEAISIVTVPLLLAMLLAYLFEPIIGWLSKQNRFGRRGAVTIILAAVVGVVVIPAVLGLAYGGVQLAGLAANSAERFSMVYDSVQSPDDEALADIVTTKAGDGWRWVRDRVVDSPEGFDQLLDLAQGWVKANAESIAGVTASAGRDAINASLGFLFGAFNLGFMLFLTAFFFFFIAVQWGKVLELGHKVLPDAEHDRIVELAVKCDAVIAGFVRGRVTIAFIQGIFFSLAYWAIGVPASFILGPLVAVLSIVPYLAMVGIPISVVLLFLEKHTGIRGTWWWSIAAPLGVYFLGQALDDYVLTPTIQGKTTNMDTPTILFASLAGGALFGVFGLLIAIPIAACLKILIQEVFWPRFKAWTEGREKDFLPIE